MAITYSSQLTSITAAEFDNHRCQHGGSFCFCRWPLWFRNITGTKSFACPTALLY